MQLARQVFAADDDEDLVLRMEEKMDQFLMDNPDRMPVGLQSEVKYIISVRKPTKGASNND